MRNTARSVANDVVQPRVSGATDSGGVRRNNEDCFAAPPYRQLRLESLSLGQAAYDRKGVLYVVADGMGGALAGEVASQMAVRTLVKTYYKDTDDDIQRSLWRAFDAANVAVHRHSLSEPKFEGMGTTMTALVLRGDHAYWANVGDSRLYLLRDGRMARISKDHTVVQELVDKGVINREEARTHPQRNELKRAMGTQGKVDIDVGRVELAVDDLFLLSTDGLHDELSDEQIKRVLMQDTKNTPHVLIHAAMQVNGGPDNITALIVEVPGEGNLVPPIIGPGTNWTRVIKQTAASLALVASVLLYMRYGDDILGRLSPTTVSAPTAEIERVPEAEPGAGATEAEVANNLPPEPLPTDTAAPRPTGTPTPRLSNFFRNFIGGPTPQSASTAGATPTATKTLPPVIISDGDDDDDDDDKKPATAIHVSPTEPPSPTDPPDPRDPNPPEPTDPPDPRDPNPPYPIDLPESRG